MRPALVRLALAIGASSVACDSTEPEAPPNATARSPSATSLPETVPLTPTASPSPTSTTAPDVEDRRTGDATIDAVIEAVEQRDVPALLELTEMQSVACVASMEGLGGPPLCREGEEEGTVVEVFPALTARACSITSQEQSSDSSSLQLAACRCCATVRVFSRLGSG